MRVGELCAGRLALDGAQVSVGDPAILRALTDNSRRPTVPNASLSQSVLEAQPEACLLDEDLFIECLRSSRRGAADSPSGMTADNLQPVLDTERDSSLFFRFATVLARGQAPVAAVEGVRMGRITALRKADGGVRGIVVGDILPRWVAKQMSASVEATTTPFQCTLTTKVDCESVTHVLQSLTDQDERATIVSIDGVGAYDLISLNARWKVWPQSQKATSCCHSCDIFTDPRQYIWEDDTGETHWIPQGEGVHNATP